MVDGYSDDTSEKLLTGTRSRKMYDVAMQLVSSKEYREEVQCT
jgi:hypothetical protein